MHAPGDQERGSERRSAAAQLTLAAPARNREPALLSPHVVLQRLSLSLSLTLTHRLLIPVTLLHPLLLSLLLLLLRPLLACLPGLSCILSLSLSPTAAKLRLQLHMDDMSVIR